MLREDKKDGFFTLVLVAIDRYGLVDGAGILHFQIQFIKNIHKNLLRIASRIQDSRCGRRRQGKSKGYADWKGVRGMEERTLRPFVIGHGVSLKEWKPNAYKFALRLMEAAEELDVSVAEFEAAVDHVKEWCQETNYQLTSRTRISDVRRNRDAVIEEFGEG
nr:MAG TPA: hypothetical protein [Caudoviricetes sp.]